MFCILILYSQCVFLCVPVRELEIEPCNKCCAFPDRIAESSSTAALPKQKKRTDLIQNAVVFSRNTAHHDMHLIIMIPHSVRTKTERVVLWF